jgi:hypothetical protein
MSLFIIILCLHGQWVLGAGSEGDCVKEYKSAGACMRLGFKKAPCRLTVCSSGKPSLKKSLATLVNPLF